MLNIIPPIVHGSSTKLTRLKKSFIIIIQNGNIKFDGLVYRRFFPVKLLGDVKDKCSYNLFRAINVLNIIYSETL